MTSLCDLTADDVERRPGVDAFPLEASGVGRDVRCTDLTDIEVCRLQEASSVGHVVDESSKQVEGRSRGDALPLEAVRDGRSFRCTDQSDVKVGQQYGSSRIGQVVGQSSECVVHVVRPEIHRAEDLDTVNGNRFIRQEVSSVHLVPGRAGPVVSSKEVNSVGLDSHPNSVQ